MSRSYRKRTIGSQLYGFLSLMLLFLGALVMLLPLVWMVSSSLKPLEEVFRIPVQWIPDELMLQNYVQPLQQRPFFLYLRNSIIVSFTVTFSNVLFCSLAGFGLTKYRFPGRRVLFIVMLSVMMLPVEVRAVPQFLLIRSLGWIDSLRALIVPNAVTALGVFIMHQFYLTFPTELLESGRIDGASEPKIFFRIALPNSVTAISSLTILTFLMIWNDYFWPLIVINTDANRTLPLGIALFDDVYRTQYNELMAVSILVSLPVVLVFLLMQRRFIEGVVTSGIKG